MFVDAIATIIILIICAFGAIFVGRALFGDDDDSRIIRIVASSVCFIIFMTIARFGLDAVFGGFNIEKELEKDPMFQALKLKHPDKFEKIVWELELLEKTGKLSENNILIMSHHKLAPIIGDIVGNAGDNSRHQFATALAENIRILKVRDDTACYDAMFNPQANADKMHLVSEAFNDSGMDEAMIAAINDSGVDKSTASEKVMQQTAQQAFQHLGRKYGQDTMLIATPEKAITTEDKRKICDMLVDFYNYLNDPNDKAKMATLRTILEEASNM